MKLRRKIKLGLLGLVAISIFWLAYGLSHNEPCGPAPTLVTNTELMNASTRRCYGGPEVVQFEQIAKPVAADNEILVKVRAAGVNPLDWHYIRGLPYLIRFDSGLGKPVNPAVGVDFAGTVEAIGKAVTRFKVGDNVFGGGNGSFAEYLTISETGGVALIPTNVTFEQAAAVPIAAITALQALRDRGRLRAGEKVLINGASGGVGTYAVQLAKLFGAEVTGVCSTRNIELVKSLGADHVIDYTQADYTVSGERYDLIIDMVSNHSLSENRDVLTAKGTYVIIGGGKGNWLGPMIGPIKAYLYSPFVGQQMGLMMASMEGDDLVTLADFMQAGDMVSVIDSIYPLSEVPAAIRQSEDGHARGKIVISVE